MSVGSHFFLCMGNRKRKIAPQILVGQFQQKQCISAFKVISSVKTCNACTKCEGRPGILHVHDCTTNCRARTLSRLRSK